MQVASFRPLSSLRVTRMLLTHRYHHNDTWRYGQDLYISFSSRQIPILEAGRSKVQVCGRSLAGIASTNHGGSHGCLLCCVLSGRGLCDGPICCPQES